MFVALSRFEIRTDMAEEVRQAFRARPHLVDEEQGFLGMQVMSPVENSAPKAARPAEKTLPSICNSCGRYASSALSSRWSTMFAGSPACSLRAALLDLNRDSSVSQHTLARSNITLKQREVEFVEASLTDVLTGVGNRRKLEQVPSSEISRRERHGGTLCAIMADIDHFKRVNDEYGHSVGDEVLVRFGARLRAHTRQTDTVARFGGEEFIVLLPHTKLADALSKAEQLRGALETQHIEPLSRSVTSSFGAAELLSGEKNDGFFRRLDAALYAAKAAGRNTVVAAASA